MRVAIVAIVLAGLSSHAARAGFTGLLVSRQIEAGSLLHDGQTFQDFKEEQNSSLGLWADGVSTALSRNSMVVNSQSSHASRVNPTRLNGSAGLSQFTRTLGTAQGRSTGSSEFLVHFNIENTIEFAYSYDFYINVESSDTRSAHAQILLMRLDDATIFLGEQITSGRVARGGSLTLQPARYAFLVESAMLIGTLGDERHDGAVNTTFDFAMIPAPGAAGLAGVSLMALRRRRAAHRHPIR